MIGIQFLPFEQVLGFSLLKFKFIFPMNFLYLFITFICQPQFLPREANGFRKI